MYFYHFYMQVLDITMGAGKALENFKWTLISSSGLYVLSEHCVIGGELFVSGQLI